MVVMAVGRTVVPLTTLYVDAQSTVGVARLEIMLAVTAGAAKELPSSPLGSASSRDLVHCQNCVFMMYANVVWNGHLRHYSAISKKK